MPLAVMWKPLGSYTTSISTKYSATSITMSRTRWPRKTFPKRFLSKPGRQSNPVGVEKTPSSPGYIESHIISWLTITAASEDVDIMYDGGTLETTQSNDQGSFEITFPAPESQSGEHLVAAGYGGENHANAPFAMESVPPDRPALISPSDGSRVGLIGSEVAPTFRWSAVSDDSGVHYRLQIATSPDFDEPSMIASVTGLTGTSYTIDEALPMGSYYWTVQAVDGAENESDWTAARSFRIGLLPLWAFVVIIVAVVVLLAALIRIRVRRRIIYYDGW